MIIPYDYTICNYFLLLLFISTLNDDLFDVFLSQIFYIIKL